MFETQTIALIVLLVLAWGVQFFMTNAQSRAFHKRSQQLRATGSRMAVGMAGSNWKRKTYGILVVDDDDRVTAAEDLSGFTVFARSKPVSGVPGTHLDQIGEGDPPQGVSPKTWEALDQAAGFLRRGRDTTEAT
ncbi:MAG: transcriptional regulator [Acidimicrobiia bacterium]|nr:transcriptional regulator [Acidimicrobiia bacterium]